MSYDQVSTPKKVSLARSTKTKNPSAPLRGRAPELLTVEASQGEPDDLLYIEQVAEWLGMSVAWLNLGRFRGYGPPFVKVRHMIRYRRGDVADWLKKSVTTLTPRKRRGPQKNPNPRGPQKSPRPLTLRNG